MNKISDAAVEAAGEAISMYLRGSEVAWREDKNTARVAIEAALPHLQPSPAGQRDALTPWLEVRGLSASIVKNLEAFAASPHKASWCGLLDDALMFADIINKSAAALATRQPVGEPVAYLDLGAGGYMDVGTDLSDDELAALPKGRHMLGIIGTYGVDGYKTPPAQAMSTDVRAVIREYLDAEEAFRDATRNNWGPDKRLGHTDPVLLRLRDASTALRKIAGDAIEAEPAKAVVEMPILERLADAFDCFWNPAVQSVQDASYHGPASGSDVVGAIAKGISAIAERLREEAQPAQAVDLEQFRDLIGFAALAAINLPETDPRRDFIRQADEFAKLIEGSKAVGNG